MSASKSSSSQKKDYKLPEGNALGANAGHRKWNQTLISVRDMCSIADVANDLNVGRHWDALTRVPGAVCPQRPVAEQTYVQQCQALQGRPSELANYKKENKK